MLFVIPCVICIFNTALAARQVVDLSDKKYKDSVLQKIGDLVAEKYVILEKAKIYAEAFRERCKNGRYDSFTDPKEFAERVNTDLISITKDKHFHFRLIESSDVGENPESSLHHPVRYHRLGIKENKGFSRLEWLEGNIGYLDIRRFYNYSDIKDRVTGAVLFLSNADAVIIDIRENGGGSGDYLSSYFLEHPTQLNSSYSREDDILTEYWTIKDIGVDRLVDVPVFLLTSERTFSAAESFAYDMKARGRAVLVGDSTGGGAHSVDLYQVEDYFEIYIPTERAVNPVTGGNWEGNGVIPDVLVPAESALDTALVLAKKAAAAYADKREARLKTAVEEMQVLMDRAEKQLRENETENGNEALEAVFDIARENGLLNEFFIDVLAYNFTSPEDEQILYAILKTKIKMYPDEPAPYENLGYAYYLNNQKKLAIGCFERVLELDPENKNARKWIERIKGI